MSDAVQASTEDCQYQIPPMILRSQAAFDRDLPQLLKTHHRLWVAYHGDDQIGFGGTETDLYEECFRRGLKENEFLVCYVATDTAIPN